MRKHALVVDGYSAGNLLAGEFKTRGLGAIHVQSTEEIWPILTLTYRPQEYDHHLAFTGDLEALVAQVRPLQPVCVVPGTETGVAVADGLSAALGLLSNGTRMSDARRNKYLMMEAVRASGLRAIEQIKSDRVSDILDWVADRKLKRVVIKPVKSAGTDSVAICDTSEDIRSGCAAILGKFNQIGLMNDDVLCQEFMAGTEYALDAVSFEGTSHFTAIWQYYKVTANGRDCVYDRDELVSCTDPIGTQLCDYTRGVLAALQITQGPSHTEIMLTREGPVLIECGTRLNGTTTPPLHHLCVGYGQLDLTVDAYVDPTAFWKKASQPYELKQHALAVSLISDQEGVVKAVPGLGQIQSLPSFNDAYMRARPGYRMRPTIDYYTNPGFVMLVHPDREVLQMDLATIRRLEKEGIYEFEPSAC